MFDTIVVRPLAIILRAFILSAVFVASVFADEAAIADPTRFDIEQQPLKSALTEFARQSDREILYSTNVVADKEAPQIDGVFEPEEALDLLLADSGLDYSVTASDTFLVNEVGGDRDPGNVSPTPVLMAQNQTSAKQGQTNSQSSENRQDGETPIEIEEIIVTGSNIRGVQNSASPVFTFDRADIDASGHATLNQFVQTIPQNFGGGANENAAGGTAPNDSSSPAQGTGINLRGLGNTSTLTLINGRRVAPANIVSFTDIASIPTSAIDRIEVLPDGASAIYGSDAIGGVVNIIMRDDYDGAETRVRYGTVTDGGLDEVQVAQTVGKNWSTGNALATYEYFGRTALDAADRNFGGNAPEPQDLLPDVSRHSLFASGRQELVDGVELSAQGYFNTRTVEQNVSRIIQLFNDDTVRAYGGTIGVEADVATEWRLLLSGTYGRNDLETESFRPDGTLSLGRKIDYSVGTFDVIADGPILKLPGGQILFAIGGHYRDEELSTSQTFSSSGDDSLPGIGRDVIAAFGELFIPFIGEPNSVTGVERLELTLAYRHEDYSDFGTTGDPKFGLLWSPAKGVNFRGTWGTSFRAPTLREINPGGIAGFIFPFPDPVLGATVPILLTTANFNSELGPEEATTWTAGVDIEPESLPGLAMKFTYFDVDFSDRIERPFGANPLSGLQPEFASLVIRDPNLAQVQSFVDQVSPTLIFFDPSDTALLSSVRTIIDSRPINVANVQVSGLDIAVDYAFDTQLGGFAFGFNGSYMFDWDKQIVSGNPVVSELNRVFNPSDLRLRGRAGWSRGGTSGTLFVNHVGGSVNNVVTPEAQIDSWTTWDLSLQYDPQDTVDNSWVDGLSFSFNVINLFDRDPPFVENPSTGGGTGVNFDGTNANALGRFVAFQITKKW